MIEDIKNIKSSKSDVRKFAITVGLLLLLISGFLLWKEKASFQPILIIGIILLAGGVALPTIFKPIYWVWMAFATILGWVMTRVILSVVFFLVITPIGLIARLVGKQFLELKCDNSQDTYWDYRSTEKHSLESYEKQF
ncbi:MAG: SxtJ family membrane protein [Deltaproteobacteria bacterium]|nr:SxtJ family membrane protein [Deltaproteobacteria bacterium]